jgi:hypothetical protein
MERAPRMEAGSAQETNRVKLSAISNHKSSEELVSASRTAATHLSQACLLLRRSACERAHDLAGRLIPFVAELESLPQSEVQR